MTTAEREHREALKQAYANPPWKTQQWDTLDWIGSEMGYRVGVRGLSRQARDRVLVRLFEAKVPCKVWAGSLVWRHEEVEAMLKARTNRPSKEEQNGNDTV